jgi:hypothetical protein
MTEHHIIRAAHSMQNVHLYMPVDADAYAQQ